MVIVIIALKFSLTWPSTVYILDFDPSCLCAGGVHGIILDNNSFSTLPPGSLFDGFTFVSCVGCGISSIAAGEIGTFSGGPGVSGGGGATGTALFLYLANNELTSLPTGVFGGFSGDVL